MSFKLPSVFAYATVLMLSVNAYGNLVVSYPTPTSGQWYDAPGITNSSAVGSSGAFWDNYSDDRTGDLASGKCNIGYILAGATSGCNPLLTTSLATPPNNGNGLAYFAGSNSTTPVGWSMKNLPDNTSNSLELMLEVAGNASSNIFGYTTGTGSSLAHHVLFSGSASPTSSNISSFIVAPGQEFAFFICGAAACASGDYSSAFYSNDPYTGNGTGKFALFSEEPSAIEDLQISDPNITSYWLGVEDLADSGVNEGVGDYNDMVIKIKTLSVITHGDVPEPGFYGLLSLGLGGLALFARRRRLS